MIVTHWTNGLCFSVRVSGIGARSVWEGVTGYRAGEAVGEIVGENDRLQKQLHEDRFGWVNIEGRP